jgi:hypothetical protein
VLAVHCGLREGELLALRWDDMVDVGPPGPPCSCGARSPEEKTVADTSWARPRNPAGEGVYASPGGR